MYYSFKNNGLGFNLTKFPNASLMNWILKKNSKRHINNAMKKIKVISMSYISTTFLCLIHTYDPPILMWGIKNQGILLLGSK